LSDFVFSFFSYSALTNHKSCAFGLHNYMQTKLTNHKSCAFGLHRYTQTKFTENILSAIFALFGLCISSDLVSYKHHIYNYNWWTIWL